MSGSGKYIRIIAWVLLLTLSGNANLLYPVSADGTNQQFLPVIFSDYYNGPMPPEYYFSGHIGPEGGTVTALAVTPSQPGVVYAGTKSSGVYKSLDNGNTWFYANQGLTNPFVYSVAIDPHDPATVYAGTFGSGIFKSTDGGATWNPAGPGLNDGAVVYALAINPANPDIIFAGTRGSENITDNPNCQGEGPDGIDYGGGIFLSIDAGAHWTKVDGGQACGYVYGIAIDPTNTNNVYAATHLKGILKSVNGGASFSYANSGLADISTRSIIVDPNQPNILYASTWYSEGVVISYDFGNSWNNLSSGIPDAHVLKLALDPISGNRYALVWGHGLYRLSNNASTWTPTGSSGFNAYDMAISTANPAILMIGTQNLGVFASSNYGDSCDLSNQGLYSVDINTLVYDPSSQSTLYAGSGRLGVFKSSDNGISWSAIRNGLPIDAEGEYYSIMDIAADPENPGVLYAGTDGSGIYKSGDGGNSWAAVNNGLPTINNYLNSENNYNIQLPHPGGDDPLFLDEGYIGTATIQSPLSPPLGSRSVLALVIDPNDTGTIYAGSGSGVYKTTNGGGGWNSSGLADQYVFSLAMNLQNPLTIFAGTANGIYKTDDGGDDWTQVGLAGDLIYSLAIDPTMTDIVYAGTAAQGIYLTGDGGSSWMEDNQDLGDLHVYSVAIDPDQPLFQYAGTAGGLYRSTKGGSRWELIDLKTYFDYIDPVVIIATSPNHLNLGCGSGTIWVDFSYDPPLQTFLPLVSNQVQSYFSPYPAP
jgi:photosystem II stability/assembly factor-like uncharacterized protein